MENYVIAEVYATVRDDISSFDDPDVKGIFKSPRDMRIVSNPLKEFCSIIKSLKFYGRSFSIFQIDISNDDDPNIDVVFEICVLDQEGIPDYTITCAKDK